MPKSLHLSWRWWFFAPLALLILAVLAPPSLWLLIAALTWRGRLIALTGLLASIWPWLLVIPLSRETARPVRIGWAVITLLGLALIFLAAPSGQPDSNSPITHRWTGRASFQRFGIANLVPESEQWNAGFLIMPIADGPLDPAEARRAKGFTDKIYSEMERDPDFYALGSTMGLAYSDLFGGSPDSGHYYLYVPRNHPDEPLPALIFLHGSAGNFKAYTRLLSRVAEERGIVIIAPTFGFGNWREEGGVETVMRALQDAQTVIQIDSEQVYLIGLSNGGLGVSLTASQYPEQFKGLGFLSPVFATEVTDQPAFLDAWQNRPVLIISGEADDRIPISYVRERAALFEANDIDVRLITYPGEDHFLVFARHDEIIADLLEWLTP